MANLGITRYQDLIGRTDLLKAAENIGNPKAKFLNLELILKNALHMRPGVDIVAGSKSQVRYTANWDPASVGSASVK